MLPAPSRYAAGTTNFFGIGRSGNSRNELLPSSFTFSPLRQACGPQIGLRGFSPSRNPKFLRDPLSDWSNSAAPGGCSFGEARSERCHQATVAVSLFKEPLPKK